jgi:putative transposase
LDLFILRGIPGYIRSDNVLCGEAAAALGQQISTRRLAGSALQSE